jgi:hypothetical protein
MVDHFSTDQSQLFITGDLINQMVDNASFDLDTPKIALTNPSDRINIALVLKGDHMLSKPLGFPISGFPRCFATEDSDRRKSIHYFPVLLKCVFTACR